MPVAPAFAQARKDDLPRLDSERERVLTPSEQAKVADLKKRGNDAMDSRLHAEALAAYDEAYKISLQPSLLYNQGRALAGMGRYPEALEKFAKFRKEATAALLAQVSGLDEFERSLEGKVGTIDIEVNVDQLEVRVTDDRGERVVKKVEKPRYAANAEPREKKTHVVLRLNAGAPKLRITSPDHIESEQSVALVGGATLILAVKLTPVNMGRLEVTAESVGATVLVDGERRGNVPLEMEIKPGAHKVRLEKDGFDASESNVFVSAGERQKMHLASLQQSGLLSKWWFWTAVGVVVVAGTTVGIVAATSTRDYDTGTICPTAGPCRVSTSLIRF